METLSITPAVALMYPAAFPFIVVLLLLPSLRFLPTKWQPRTLLIPDLIVLLGIILPFALFDPESIRHFFDPNRPMDWIPLLTLATFFVRNIVPPASRLLAESGAMLAGLLLLTLPLLRQESLTQGALSLSLTFAAWLAIRFSYPVDRIRGLDPVSLLPLFLTSASLAALSPLSGSLLLGQLAGGLSAVFLAMCLAAPLGTRASGIEPGWMLGALLVIGLRYVDISADVIGFLALSLFIGGVAGRLLSLRGRTGTGKRVLIVTGLSLLPLAAGIFEALKDLKNQGGGY
ncbi:MAG: hypothetical protein M0041_04765 [Nitrospiraceae bacterium]|nr:hypothetical protein [Nitrospiraceae bacterium]